MKFYDETHPLYLETDTSGIGLGTALLQPRDGAQFPRDIVPDNSIPTPIMFASKSLTSVERRYSNIEREALDILHGLERFCHYCLAREVSKITDHKPFVTILKKKMLQDCHKEYNEFSSGYINFESTYYRNLDWICSSQTGFPDTT